MKFEFGDVVSIHIHQDVLDHDDTELLTGPDFVDFLQQLVLVAILQFLNDGVEEFDGGVLDSLVEQVSMLVEDEVVSRPVEFFVGKGTGLYGVYFVDCFLYRVPILEGLLLGHY